MKITLTSVYRTMKDKQGQPLLTKDGRTYERVLVKAKEYGDKLISGFGDRWNETWKQGDVVEVEIEEVNKNGQTYLNFHRIDKIAELESRIAKIENHLFGGPQPTTADARSEEDEPVDLPF